MKLTIIFINIFTLCCLLFALYKDKTKAKKALIVALKASIRIIPAILMIILLIGLLMGFVPENEIAKISDEHSGFLGVFLTALLGAIMHIPSLLSFPLGASLLENGASYAIVATFIVSLTMIGTITLPLEIKELGKKVAILRNGMSFVIAIIIGLIMGAIL